MKKGDKVRIIGGKYEGQIGKIATLFDNGAMIERDVEEERRFTTVMFEHLESL